MIIVVDVDGVLAKSPQKPANDMAVAFDMLAAQGHALYACTGTGYDEISAQVSNCSFDGIFSDSGALLNGSPHSFTPEPVPVPLIGGGQREFRVVKRQYGLYLDFSHKIGRARFIRFIEGSGIRKRVQAIAKTIYPEYQFLIGGQVSIDVLTKGKECAIEYLRDVYPHEKIMYIGDRCYEGGNDYLAFKAADIGIQINDISQTLPLFRLMLGKYNYM